MASRRRRPTVGRLVAAWLLVMAAAAAPSIAGAGEAPVRPVGEVQRAAPPRESCLTDAPAGGGFIVCGPTAGGGGSFNLGGLLPLLGAVVLGAGLALAIAYLVLRRRAASPLDPVDAGEWWTCTKCGSNNVVGSARCYSCGTWQR